MERELRRQIVIGTVADYARKSGIINGLSDRELAQVLREIADLLCMEK